MFRLCQIKIPFEAQQLGREWERERENKKYRGNRKGKRDCYWVQHRSMCVNVFGGNVNKKPRYYLLRVLCLVAQFWARGLVLRATSFTNASKSFNSSNIYSHFYLCGPLPSSSFGNKSNRRTATTRIKEEKKSCLIFNVVICCDWIIFMFHIVHIILALWIFCMLYFSSGICSNANFIPLCARILSVCLLF